jgi:glycosyltransferase involved in cell wall biosynthesis
MNVLMVTPWYPSQQSPIYGAFVRDCAEAVRLFDAVTVVHLADGERRASLVAEADPELTHGISTYHLHHRRLPIPGTAHLSQIWALRRAVRQITRDGFKPDIIHAHVYSAGFSAVVVGRMTGIPVVITEHATAFGRGILGKADLWQVRQAFRRAARVMPVSEYLRQTLSDYGIEARWQVVSNVVDPAAFHPGSRRRVAGEPARLIVVAFLDKSHKKGIPFLLTALAQLRSRRQDWHLDIVGDGEARAEYERQAAELAIADKVRFHGMKAKEQVADLIREADLLVVSSVFETFSVAAAEALMCGVPVLTTRCGGPEGFVTEAVGHVVAKADADALAEGLNGMLDRLDAYDRRAISQYAEGLFSPKRVGARLHEIYLDCLKERG